MIAQLPLSQRFDLIPGCPGYNTGMESSTPRLGRRARIGVMKVCAA